jgi:hypothetical protein
MGVSQSRATEENVAEASVLILWGTNKVGRETMGLGIFTNAVAFFEKERHAGRLEDVKVGIGDTGALSQTAGYLVAEGTNEQITNLLANAEFKAHTLKAFHVVDGFQVVRCATGTAIPMRIEQLVAVRRELGIP